MAEAGKRIYAGLHAGVMNPRPCLGGLLNLRISAPTTERSVAAFSRTRRHDPFADIRPEVSRGVCGRLLRGITGAFAGCLCGVHFGPPGIFRSLLFRTRICGTRD